MRRDPNWFFEEGFAEFVARQVETSAPGFPWYGYPEAVVAGQWLANGEGIPLSLLRDNHRGLNLPCKAQSYALRASFFLYLGRTYGADTVLRMAAGDRAGARADYPRHFEKGFEAVEAEWRASVMARYRAIPDADDQARRYRRESPVQYMEVCRKGAQF